jgi:hypothetical protein
MAPPSGIDALGPSGLDPIRCAGLTVAIACAVLAALVGLPVPARAASWGGIEPGVSTTQQVRERFGPPTKETRAKVESYETVQWVFEGGSAPGGMVRMTVEFGLLEDKRFRPDVVRVLRLDPKPLVFGLNTVVQGWGEPDVIATEGERRALYFRSGVIVLFDKDKEEQGAVAIVLTPPQPGATSATTSSPPVLVPPPVPPAPDPTPPALPPAPR